jgi:hypothetical protein
MQGKICENHANKLSGMLRKNQLSLPMSPSSMAPDNIDSNKSAGAVEINLTLSSKSKQKPSLGKEK